MRHFHSVQSTAGAITVCTEDTFESQKYFAICVLIDEENDLTNRNERLKSIEIRFIAEIIEINSSPLYYLRHSTKVAMGALIANT